VLLDVIHGSGSRRGIVDVAAPVASQQNEGFARGLAAGTLDQLDPGPVGKLLIDQIDIVFVGLNPRDARGGGRDDLKAGFERRIRERHLDERGGLWIVVDQQDAHRLQIRQGTVGRRAQRARVPVLGTAHAQVLSRRCGAVSSSERAV
jgi:hypothetical protein